MILDPAHQPGEPSPTLDDLFRCAGVRRPHALALVDPPNRARIAGGAPRRLTYAHADRIISAIAARLRGLGLATDAVVALQLPNTVESVLALLGIIRAGMIAAPLPLLWHRQDIVAALRGTGVKAFLTSADATACAQADIAVQAAASLFSIRHVCAFGTPVPDGVTPFDDVFADEAEATIPITHLADPAAHVAVVTFDFDGDAVARNHRELIAAGLVVRDEAGLVDDDDVLSTVAPGSFAGLASSVVPWLINGGTLALHHSFDAVSFVKQCRAQDFDAVVVPGPAIEYLAAAGLLQPVRRVLALWRAPERLAAAAPWQTARALVDVACFGETGLIAARRGCDGKPAALPLGEIIAGSVGRPVVETARGPAGTLQLRGPMVPSQAFPLGAKTRSSFGDYIDTGYPCRFAADGRALIVTAAPAGITTIGGYRFMTRELDQLANRLGTAVTLAALPHALLGEQLAAMSSNSGVADELGELGVSPLIVGAARRPITG
jgi:hypothetical protein